MALDRMAATIMVTEAERAEMQTEAGAAGLSFAQYVRFQMQFLRIDFAEHYVWPSKWLDGRGRFRRFRPQLLNRFPHLLAVTLLIFSRLAQ